MKAKELKQLRKKIEKADRLEDPLDSLVGGVFGRYTLFAHGGGEGHELALCSNNDNDSDESLRLSWHKTWQSLQPPSRLFHDMLALFQENMGEMYAQSSWGLNMEEKKDEFQHRKARFLIVTTTTTIATTDTMKETQAKAGDNSRDNQHEQQQVQQQQVLAFCHYRFEYDDDQDPTCAALYLYEIQVSSNFQSKGLGQCLMELLHGIAQQAAMPKIMLTVFVSNQQAMAFYRSNKLQYEVDETSPSQHDEVADYEILSKRVLPLKPDE